MTYKDLQELYMEIGLTADQAHAAIMGVAQLMLRAATGRDNIHAIGAAGFIPRKSTMDNQCPLPRRRTATA